MTAAFATRLAGLALLLTGDRNTAATLVHTALTADRTPDERQATAALVRAWLAGPPLVGEPVELSDDLESLRRALDALPEEQRLAVLLHHWSGLAVPDIAAILRRPERTVVADLAAGVAELPDEPVATRLAALVAAAGPPPVNLADVAEAGRAQRRHRRRTAVVAAAVLLAAATVAALLTAGEPERATVTWSGTRLKFEVLPVIDDRARRLTEQLAAAMDDVLPGVTDLRPGDNLLEPLEFSTGSGRGSNKTYFAEASFGTTLLLVHVHSLAPDPYPPCSAPGTKLGCTFREFPDGTVAEVLVNTESDRTAFTLLSRRPDGTIFSVIAYTVGAPGPPDLTAEDLFGFATVFTY